MKRVDVDVDTYDVLAIVTILPTILDRSRNTTQYQSVYVSTFQKTDVLLILSNLNSSHTFIYFRDVL